MEIAPPVPPKDTPCKRKSQLDHSSSAPNSVSKRKREDMLLNASSSEADFTEHTPKRHRLSPTHDAEASESTSARQQSTLRRKRGVKNLSSLNLRHKAEQGRLLDQQQPRESKFQEGSLTDKPSQKPPSAFTRIINTDGSGHLEHVDTLMNDYHDGIPTPGDSSDSLVLGASADTMNGNNGNEQTSVFYRFGQRLASGFRPVALWNKIWNETKEELTMRNMEIELKRRQKLEAEKQYALMKQTGQIPSKKAHANMGSVSHRDSGIEMVEENRLSAFEPYQISRDGTFSRADSRLAEDGGECGVDGEKTLRGRKHFTRPSLSNLRRTLKRTRSEVNFLGSSNRESSASVSPVKLDANVPELHKSHSRADLKKQHKLSKRVSDLEMKLSVARRELDDALNDASPMTQLGSKYERFTPLSTMKRKFVPGGLPTLPSERLLDAEAMSQKERVDTQYGDGEATVRPVRAKAYPRRAVDLFDDEPRKDSSMTPAAMDDSIEDISDSAEAYESIVITQATPPGSDEVAHNMPELETPVSKQTRIKKRKPERESNDMESELSSVKKIIKRRKSTIGDTASTIVYDTNEEQTNTDDFAESFTGIKRSASVRLSIDSTTHSLEPVYEEEEGMTTVPLNDDPSMPTATATPARFGGTIRSMSPVKRSGVKAAFEEVIFTRAADAVRNQPARQARSRSPAKVDDEYEWPEDVF